MSWSIENNKLVKLFSFETQTKLAEFFRLIAVQADEVNHHPDISVFKATKLKIELTTHDKNAITELDYSLSRFIDEAYLNFQLKN